MSINRSILKKLYFYYFKRITSSNQGFKILSGVALFFSCLLTIPYFFGAFLSTETNVNNEQRKKVIFDAAIVVQKEEVLVLEKLEKICVIYKAIFDLIIENES